MKLSMLLLMAIEGCSCPCSKPPDTVQSCYAQIRGGNDLDMSAFCNGVAVSLAEKELSEHQELK